MSTVLNRITKQFIASANTPDYPAAGWIVNPDMSAVNGQPPKYWKITGDSVSLMTAGEQATADSAELSAQRDMIATAMDRLEDYSRAFALTVLDEINLHAARVTAILDAVDGASSLAALKTAVLAIPDVPQRTIAQLKTAVRGKLGS
jgi:hypothetical protein